MPDLRGAIEIAESRIRPYVRQTLLEYSPFFSEATQAQVFMKLENLQHTGSFKVRGAYNKLLSLTPAGNGLLSTVDHARADQFLAVLRPLPLAERALVAMGVAALANHAMTPRGSLRKGTDAKED